MEQETRIENIVQNDADPVALKQEMHLISFDSVNVPDLEHRVFLTKFCFDPEKRSYTIDIQIDKIIKSSGLPFNGIERTNYTLKNKDGYDTVVYEVTRDENGNIITEVEVSRDTVAPEVFFTNVKNLIVQSFPLIVQDIQTFKDAGRLPLD